MAGPTQPPSISSLQQRTRRWRFGVAAGFIEGSKDPPLTEGLVVGGRYRIHRVIGEGGMGRVYESEHTVLRKPVALKLLDRGLALDATQVARFEQEATAVSQIGHRNLVAVMDFDQTPAGQVYIVMERLLGESLADRMHRPGTLLDVLPCFIGICSGLQAAHDAGVIHRDLKPANLFLSIDSGGTLIPKVLDFGIAKVVVRHTGAPKTEIGTILGTPYYLAPERALGEELTPAADVYSLAVILYELITGEVPFDGENHFDVIGHHVRSLPLDPRQRRPELQIPDALAKLVMLGLAKEPSLRPQSAKQLADAIHRVLESSSDELQLIPLSVPASAELRPMGLSSASDRATVAPLSAQRAEHTGIQTQVMRPHQGLLGGEPTETGLLEQAGRADFSPRFALRLVPGLLVLAVAGSLVWLRSSSETLSADPPPIVLTPKSSPAAMPIFPPTAEKSALSPPNQAFASTTGLPISRNLTVSGTPQPSQDVASSKPQDPLRRRTAGTKRRGLASNAGEQRAKAKMHDIPRSSSTVSVPPRPPNSKRPIAPKIKQDVYDD